MPKKEITIPRSFYTDLDIFTADGSKYDANKIKNIDENKINFSRENALAYMQEIDDDVRIINTRTTLLLSYLAAIVAALVIFLSRDLASENIEYPLYISVLASILLCGYLGIIFFVGSKLISPSFGAYAHNEPKNLMVQGTFKHDIKLIKILETELLQDRIKFNANRLEKLTLHFRWSMFATFALLFFGLVVAFVFAFNFDFIFHFLYSWLLT